MKTSDFDYILPESAIAQTAVEPRDHSRLLVMDRQTGELTHRHFYDLGEFLRPGDLLIVNESKVFKARIRGTSDGKSFEIFLLHPEGDHWIALAKPRKKLRVGSPVTFDDATSCVVTDKRSDGTVALSFSIPVHDVFAWADRVGDVPLPPYIEPPRLPHTQEETTKRYQTVYAKTTGSVAAPTAGLHFTAELMSQLTSAGVRFASVTLHVGLGTFRPMKTDTLEAHEMHSEWVHVPDETLHAIVETRARGGRVIAVGTTSVRALESGIREGFTNIFITPGYTFKQIDGMITNFHLPKSTLLVLVSAFAGREHVLHAYSEAIRNGYRFYSFGDAMLIV